MEAAEDVQSLTEFLYLCPVALVQFGDDGAISMMNPTGAQIFMQVARSPNVDNLYEVLRNHLPQLRRLVDESEGRRGMICENLRVNAGRPSKKSKRDLVFLVSVVRLGPGRLIATAQDISWSAEKERESREIEERMRLLIDGARDLAIVPVTLDGKVRYWHDSAERLFGYPSGHATGRPLHEVVRPDLEADDDLDVQALLELALRGLPAEAEGWLRRHSRTTFWGEMSMTRVEGADGFEGITVVARDATRRHREVEELTQRAQQDCLTGLPNRAHFNDLAHLELARWRRTGRPFCVAILDVDFFKKVNDTWGHPAGDEVLRAVARVCRQTVRDVDVVGRYGGEEFVVLLAATDLVGAEVVANRMRCAIESHVSDVDGALIQVTASVGLTEVRSGSDTIDRILARADHALYQAKAAGRNQVVCFDNSRTVTPSKA